MTLSFNKRNFWKCFIKDEFAAIKSMLSTNVGDSNCSSLINFLMKRVSKDKTLIAFGKNTFIQVEGTEEDMETVCSFDIDGDNDDNVVESFYVQKSQRDDSTFPFTLTVSNRHIKIDVTIDSFTMKLDEWMFYARRKKKSSLSPFPHCIIDEMVMLGLASFNDDDTGDGKEEYFRIYSYKVGVHRSTPPENTENKKVIIQGDSWWNVYNPKENSSFPILGSKTCEYITTSEIYKLQNFKPPDIGNAASQEDSSKEKEKEKVKTWSSNDNNISGISLVCNIFSDQVYKDVISDIDNAGNVNITNVGKIISSFQIYSRLSSSLSSFSSQYLTAIEIFNVIKIGKDVNSDSSDNGYYVYMSTLTNYIGSKNWDGRRYTILHASSLPELWSFIPDRVKCEFQNKDYSQCLEKEIAEDKKKLINFHNCVAIKDGGKMNDTYYNLLKTNFAPQLYLAMEKYLPKDFPKDLRNLILSYFFKNNFFKNENFLSKSRQKNSEEKVDRI